jgi:regulator of protease activity HflC (stomatin/prohibitin superfamily)
MKHTSWLTVTVLAGALSACATVGPGQGGVLWTSGSGTQSDAYGEGKHFIAPWNELYVYDLREMSRDVMLNVIAVNGLSLKLDASVRYHLIAKELVALQTDIGPSYYETIVEPVLRSEARRVIGKYTPEEIYSTKRDVIEREIREGLRQKIDKKHVELEAVLVRNVELPEAIRRAIDIKLAAEQEVLKMKYVLEVTKATAEQRRIEGQGIADYNAAVTQSLSPAILDFERIQAMTKLAQSSNAKTVVLGSGASPQMLVGSGSGASSSQVLLGTTSPVTSSGR